MTTRIATALFLGALLAPPAGSGQERPLITNSGLISDGDGGWRAPTPAAQQPRCPKYAERDFPMGAVIEVPTGRPPCRIQFRDTGIRLESSGDGSRPDPGRTVVVDSHGRFISANAIGWPATISVWDSRGEYLHSFGTEGKGPGEFSTMGMMNLLIDGRDHLHVRDGSLQWSVFSPEHRFLRRVPADVMGGMRGTTVVLDDGSALASDGPRRNATHYFHLVDSTGALRRPIGPLADGTSGRGSRRIAYGGGDTFWAAPGVEGGSTYVLEEWGTDGRLRRQLGRDVLEVIDTRSGRLLASEVVPVSQARQTVPRTLFAGSFLGYRYEEGPAGPVVKIVSVELVPR